MSTAPTGRQIESLNHLFDNVSSDYFRARRNNSRLLAQFLDIGSGSGLYSKPDRISSQTTGAGCGR